MTTNEHGQNPLLAESAARWAALMQPEDAALYLRCLLRTCANALRPNADIPLEEEDLDAVSHVLISSLPLCDGVVYGGEAR